MGELIHLDAYFRNHFRQVFGRELPGYEHLVDYLSDLLRSANVSQIVAQTLVKALFHAFKDQGIVPVTEEAVERLRVFDQPEAMRRLKLHTRSRFDMHFSQTQMAFFLHLEGEGYRPSDAQFAALYNIWTITYAMFAGFDYDPRIEGGEKTSAASA